MSKPPDVDNMVSSFLSELSTLYDDLGLAASEAPKPPEGSNGHPAASDPQSASPKPASYRNIDILFMHDGELKTGEQRTQQGSSASRIVNESPRSFARVWEYLRPRCFSGWMSFLESVRRDQVGGLRKCADNREIELAHQRQRVRPK